MHRFISGSLLLPLLIALAPAAGAATLYVNKSAPGPAHDGATWPTAYLTVQAALDAAGGADAIHVAQGTYAEHVTLHGDIALLGGFAGSGANPDDRSVAGHVVILDGSGAQGPVVTADDAAGSGVVDGFTIVNGSGGSDGIGGGIRIVGASPTISHNLIRLNHASLNGGGIAVQGGAPVIVANIIVSNSAASAGGAVYLAGGGAQVASNTLARNTAGYGGAIFEELGGAPRIVNNSLVENGASAGGGGMYARDDIAFANNLVAFNTSGISSELTSAKSHHNLLFGNATGDYLGGFVHGTGDVNADPKITRDTYGAVHIQPTSPARNAGDNASVIGAADIDGEPRIQQGTVDIGADESNGTAAFVNVERVLFVKADGNDANDGSSWGNAMKTVQAAVSASAVLGGEVWVKAGVYPETITLGMAVGIYGGFTGTESSRNQRPQPRLNATVLDGTGAGTSVVAVDPGSAPSTVVDGFTIQGGAGLAATGNGGGICSVNASPSIRNNLLRRNASAQFGGAIYISGGAPVIEYNVMVGNNTGSAGGGLYLGGTSATVTDNIMARNNSVYGGGVFEESSASALIINNAIVENASNADGGGIYKRDDVALVNNLIAFNTRGILSEIPSTKAHHNLVYGNAAGDYVGSAAAGPGDVNADPQITRDAYGAVHVQPSSPARNAGDNASVIGAADIDGEPRIQQGTVDIGADESNGTAAFEDVEPVVFVTPGGSDANDGGSWSNAKATLQGALSALALGGQVWVAAGTYHEGGVALSVGKSLYGGFLGTEIALDQRSNPRLHASILDATGKPGSVVTIAVGTPSTSAIDGFTLTNGTGSASDGNGGGIYVASANAAIRNNSIVKNTAVGSGGGIYVSGGAPLIADNAIVGNSAGSNGGGIYLGGSSASVDSNLLAQSAATYGASLFEESGGAPRMVNNTIVDGVAAAVGGGVYQRNDIVFANNIVAFNTDGVSSEVANAQSHDNMYFGNANGDYLGAAVAGTGDHAADPLFVNRAGDDYRLSTGSPAVDAGADSAALGLQDARGAKRVAGEHVDIGAVELQADLALKQTVSDAGPLTGSAVIYTLTVANSGPDAASSVQVTDAFPPILTGASVLNAGGGSVGGTARTPTITFPSLAAGSSASIAIQATVDCAAADGSIITNAASVTTVPPPAVPTPDPDPGNNAAGAPITASNPAPVISNVSATPSVLLNADHRMALVTVDYATADNCDQNPVNTLSALSNEPDAGAGPGDVPGDIQVLDAHHIRLRAERAGLTQARVYTITIGSKAVGNSISKQTVTVTVPAPTALDAARALRIAGGLLAAGPADLLNLDVEANGRIDLPDALRLAREAAGVEP
ncbi:MAG TPA: choice-of-anchor Q domain-containing protein [Armatimonadota bacterium]|jgi:uncharacterized repeat protein (TIGR01451 family)